VPAQLIERSGYPLWNSVEVRLSGPDLNHSMTVCSAESSPAYHLLMKLVGLFGLGSVLDQNSEIAQQTGH